jgi:hypothetical protein
MRFSSREFGMDFESFFQLGTEEVTTLVMLATSTVYTMVSAFEIPAYGIRKRQRIKCAALYHWIDAQPRSLAGGGRGE